MLSYELVKDFDDMNLESVYSILNPTILEITKTFEEETFKAYVENLYEIDNLDL